MLMSGTQRCAPLHAGSASASAPSAACLGCEQHCSHVGGAVQRAPGAQPASVDGIVQGALVAVLQAVHRMSSTWAYSLAWRQLWGRHNKPPAHAGGLALAQAIGRGGERAPRRACTRLLDDPHLLVLLGQEVAELHRLQPIRVALSLDRWQSATCAGRPQQCSSGLSASSAAPEWVPVALAGSPHRVGRHTSGSARCLDVHAPCPCCRQGRQGRQGRQAGQGSRQAGTHNCERAEHRPVTPAVHAADTPPDLSIQSNRQNGSSKMMGTHTSFAVAAAQGRPPSQPAPSHSPQQCLQHGPGAGAVRHIPPRIHPAVQDLPGRAGRQVDGGRAFFASRARRSPAWAC